MDVNFEEAFTRALRVRTVDVPELVPPPDYDSLLLPVDFTGYGLKPLANLASFSSHMILIANHRSPADLIAIALITIDRSR